MSKHRILSFKPQLRLEWRGQDGQNETEQRDHSASLGDSITASTQIRFSVHTVIAETIGAPHNTLSTHLAILVRAGLLRSSREGRTIIYRSDVEGIRSVIAFLVNDCCDGHPELCNLVAADAVACCTPASVKARSAKKTEAKRKADRWVGHDLDAVGIGGSDHRGISRGACRRRRCA
jgi:DNA-binding transcriptional ArsR family regulator